MPLLLYLIVKYLS